MSGGHMLARVRRAPFGNRLDIAAILVAIVMVGAVVFAFAAFEAHPDDWGYESARTGAKA